MGLRFDSVSLCLRLEKEMQSKLEEIEAKQKNATKDKDEEIALLKESLRVKSSLLDIQERENATLKQDITSLQQRLEDKNKELKQTTSLQQPLKDQGRVEQLLDNLSRYLPGNSKPKQRQSCRECLELEKKVKSLETDIQKKKDEIARLCAKVNADFGQHQGNSFREGGVNKQWTDLFLYQADTNFSKDYSYFQKNEVRRQLCDMFMEIDRSVQEQLLDRMIGCLKALFTTEVPNPNINMKEVQRAFSILVNIPKVTEKFELPPEIQLQKIQERHNLLTIDEFVENALLLCVKMRTRVPPFIISIDEEHFVPEVHELKPIRGSPKPEEHPEMSVFYLRPIVYYNYQKTLLIKGQVVGTLIPKKKGASAASVSQQFSADALPGEAAYLKTIELLEERIIKALQRFKLFRSKMEN